MNLPMAPVTPAANDNTGAVERSAGLRTMLGLIALAIPLIAIALVRRLNFDESLALHAGWLLFNNIEASPSFYMPFTLAIGGLASMIDDPGLLLACLRLLVTVSLLATLGWMLRQLGASALSTLVAAALMLSNAAFVAHAIEFRYDWAIVIGWAAGFALLLRPTPRSLFMIGLIISWLAMHHLKGAYFALSLYGLAWLVVMLYGAPQRGQSIRSMHVGAMVLLLAWLAISAALGKTDLLFETHFQFAGVSGATDRVSAIDALRASFARDGGWWLFCVLTSPIAFITHQRDPKVWLAAAFALVPMVFIAIHPHAWRYMLVPALPFFALLSALGLSSLWRAQFGTVVKSWRLPILIIFAGILLGAFLWRHGMVPSLVAQGLITLLALRTGRAESVSLGISLRIGTATLLMVLSVLAARVPALEPYLRALSLDRGPQVAMMRELKVVAAPTDTVLDPSGLAYFLRPVFPEWYSDTLFRSLAKRGLWMRDHASAPPADWVVLTYRLSYLPAPIQRSLAGTYCSAGNGLLAQRSNECSLEGSDSARPAALASYW